MGELVAGVAHEINNPLQTIVGAVELMLEERPDPEMRLDLEMVRREGTRAGQIVRNLLSFVRRGAPDRVAADLNEVDPRHGRSSASITCRSTTSRSSPSSRAGAVPVFVNREEIQQIALNLILNAEQAILTAGRGSRITVRSYSSGPVIRSSRSRTTAPASARSCEDESSSRSSRRRRWGRERASACRFPTASRPRTAARWISVRENRARASG